MAEKNKRDVLLNTIQLKSVAVKPKKGLDIPTVSSGPYYPDLYLNTDQVPDLKGAEVSKEVTLVVKGYICSHSLNENTSSDEKKVDQRESFSIKIKKIGLVK